MNSTFRELHVQHTDPGDRKHVMKMELRAQVIFLQSQLAEPEIQTKVDLLQTVVTREI